MFSKRCFSEWCIQKGGQDPQGQKAPKCSRRQVFSSILRPFEGVTSVAGRGAKSEKHRLENTVWNP